MWPTGAGRTSVPTILCGTFSLHGSTELASGILDDCFTFGNVDRWNGTLRRQVVLLVVVAELNDLLFQRTHSSAQKQTGSGPPLYTNEHTHTQILHLMALALTDVLLWSFFFHFQETTLQGFSLVSLLLLFFHCSNPTNQMWTNNKKTKRKKNHQKDAANLLFKGTSSQQPSEFLQLSAVCF